MKNKERGHNFLSGFGNKDFLREFAMGNTSDATPNVSASENPSGYKLEIETSGFKKEELSVKVENYDLIVTSDKKYDKVNSNENEASSGSNKQNFKKVIELPTTVDVDKIKVIYKDEVLEVLIPKKSRLNEEIIEG